MIFLKKIVRRPLTRKLMVSVWLVLVVMIGRHIPIPNVSISDYLLKDNTFLGLSASVLGGDLSRVSLFSLGLGPWMYTLILLRVANLGRKKVSSPKTDTIKRNALMLIIAIIQSLSIIVNIDFHSSANQLLLVLETMLVLVAGAFVLSWLGNMNTYFGIGGPTVIVLVSMLNTQLNAISSFYTAIFSPSNRWLTVGIFLWSLAAIYIYMIFEHAEYRIPLKRVSINSSLITETYLPIKVNSAGGMQMMYAISFLLLPQYILLLLQYLYPHNNQLSKWQSYFSTSSLAGILIYMGIIFALTLIFSFVNIDLTKTVENFRKSGDYIPNIRPGKDTKEYLKQVIIVLSVFSGFIISAIVAFPLFVALGNTDLAKVAPLTGVLMMSSAMIWIIREEIRTIQLQKQYTSLFE